MATIQKRGDVYRAQVIRKVGDQRVCRSATFATKAQARAWAVEVEADILRRQRGTPAGAASNDGKITMHRVFEIYREERAPEKRGSRWEILRCNKLSRELPFAG